MRQRSSLILSLFLTISILQAEEILSKEVTLQTLIENVKNSKNDARRKAMNALKIKLRAMNQKSRRQVIQKLQQNFSSNKRDYLYHRRDHTFIHKEYSHHTPASIQQREHLFQHPKVQRHGGNR